MKEVRVTFPSGELLLEGVMGLPEGSGPFPGVVVCHPHPLYGGSMDNNVVDSLCQALVQASLVAFKFNFRGVGASQGTYREGVGEEEDVASSISLICSRAEVDAGSIGLAGYSAGAGFACPVGVRDGRVKSLALVSSPLAMFDFEELKACLKPKLLVCAGRDNFSSLSRSLDFFRGLPEPKEWHGVAEADHFWWGQEESMAEKVTAFFIRTLKE